MLTGILVFSVLSAAVSFLIFRRHRALESAELSTYIMLIAWGSLLFGLGIARFSY